ncbi:MAG: ADP-ribosylglycohydrolase family protein [Clostridia bacterium]|nr:ADP-ribosylglycohydrolase family protein [Clostridia bacterium]
MLGVVIGDVIGSIYEVFEVKDVKSKRKYINEQKELDPNFDDSNIIRHRSYEERMDVMTCDLFDKQITYTDDTCLSCAICDALLHDKDYKKYLLSYGLEEEKKRNDIYDRSRFGKGFRAWLSNGGNCEPSLGNGSGMRVAPVAWYFDNLDDVLEHAKLTAIPSHGHEEGIKGAQAIASSIFLARNNFEKEDIKKYVEETFNYDLNKDLDDLRHNYTFNSTCEGSVPEAIYCFLESDNFEDGIRKALSIGGDADTIAAMTGAICEAYYGLDEELATKCLEYVPDDMKDVFKNFYNEIDSDIDMKIFDSKNKDDEIEL